MKLHVFWPFAFGLVAMLSMNSCTKTIVQTKTVDSTVFDTLHHTDTLRDNAGPALIRFVNMFPDSVATSLFISKTSDINASLFATAGNSVSGYYFPVRADSSNYYYFASSNTSWRDSQSFPAPGATLNTYALFLSNNNHVFPSRSIDSERLTPPPSGYCYVRLLNGIAGDPAAFYLDLDTVGNSLFGHSSPINYPSFSPYVLVKAGVHTLYLRIPQTSSVAAQKPENFEDGFYYTVRAIGSSGQAANLAIDQE